MNHKLSSVASTRDKIVTTADELFYRQGFEHTSFAHIAEQVGISRGNFYHHFKSKDDILKAVVTRRREITEALLRDWEDANAEPLARLKAFVQILINNRAAIKTYGCPVGSLCSELAKLSHPLKKDAVAIFTQFRQWLGEQFLALGYESQADELAMHLLAQSQGVATLANAFKDDRYLEREVMHLHRWLDQCSASPASARI